MTTPRCAICADPMKKDWVARRQLEGHTLRTMEDMARTAGLVMKRETISKHLKTCLAMPPDVKPSLVAELAQKVKVKPMTPEDDVAVLVQREVIQKLKDGSARVTVQHGLQAQQLLDRRAERAKDRELAVTLARLLHSPLPPVGMVQERITIEGEYEDMTT